MGEIQPPDFYNAEVYHIDRTWQPKLVEAKREFMGLDLAATQSRALPSYLMHR